MPAAGVLPPRQKECPKAVAGVSCPHAPFAPVSPAVAAHPEGPRPADGLAPAVAARARAMAASSAGSRA